MPQLSVTSIHGPQYCGLKSQDLSILAQAYAKSRLPELRHLDLSENLKIQSQVKCLFEHNSKWHQLESLDLFQSYGTDSLSAIDLQCLSTKATSGCLSSLDELTILSNSFGFSSKGKTNIVFSQLQKLYISCGCRGLIRCSTTGHFHSSFFIILVLIRQIQQNKIY